MSLPAAAEQAAQAFSQCSNWEQRARLLMQWGNNLAPLSDHECCDAHLVQGCESQVWLLGDQAGATGWHFRAYSDARLLRGLLAVLLARVNGLASAALDEVDLTDWFNQLGLGRHLSPSRSNGLHAVLRRMQQLMANNPQG